MPHSIKWKLCLPSDLNQLTLSNDLLIHPQSTPTHKNFSSLNASIHQNHINAPSEICNSIFKNPFLWSLAMAGGTAAGILFSAVLLPSAAFLPTTLTIFTILGAAYYAQSDEQKKWTYSELSLLNSKILEQIPSWIYKRNWQNEITPHITLGAAPLKNQEHFQNIKQTHQAVLSFIEDFEHDPHLFGIPAKPEDWKQAGVAFLNLPNRDMHPVKVEDVQRGVEWMHEQILQNKKVYVHCLAGVGRSATVVICYLIKYGNYSPKLAVDFVRSKRPIFINETSPAIVDFVSALHSANPENRGNINLETLS